MSEPSFHAQLTTLELIILGREDHARRRPARWPEDHAAAYLADTEILRSLLARCRRYEPHEARIEAYVAKQEAANA